MLHRYTVHSMSHTPVTKLEGIDALLYHAAARLVHVDKAAAGVHQSLELLAGTCQLQHLLRAQVVAAQCCLNVYLRAPETATRQLCNCKAADMQHTSRQVKGLVCCQQAGLM